MNNENNDHLLGPIQLLNQSFQVLKNNAKQFLILSAPLVVIDLLKTIVSPNNAPLQGFLFLISFILFIYTVLTVTLLVARRSENPSVISIISQANPKIFPFTLVSFLETLVFMGGLALFIIPGIIVTIMTQFASYIYVNENIGGMEALVRSRAYARGRWWGIFGRTVFITFIAIILQAVIMSISKYTVALSPLVTFFTIIYTYLIYENLKTLNPHVDSKQGGKTKTYLTILACAVPLLIPVIGVVSAVILLAINPAQLLRVSRDSTRQADLATLQKSVDTYYVQNNQYPQTLEQLNMEKVPTDPKSLQPYQYTILPDGSGYQICATMENKQKFPNPEYCVPQNAMEQKEQTQYQEPQAEDSYDQQIEEN